MTRTQNQAELLLNSEESEPPDSKYIYPLYTLHTTLARGIIEGQQRRQQLEQSKDYSQKIYIPINCR